MTKRVRRAPSLEAIEHASRDELESLQLERLKWSVRHAYDHVVRYRKKCEAAGAHPDDLRTLADLARFPFTTKQNLRDGYPFASFAVRRSEVIRVHASSGTTGKPAVVGYTARDIETWASLMPAPGCGRPIWPCPSRCSDGVISASTSAHDPTSREASAPSVGDGNNHVALLVSLLHVSMCIGDLFQRISAVDDRLELAGVHELFRWMILTAKLRRAIIHRDRFAARTREARAAVCPVT